MLFELTGTIGSLIVCMSAFPQIIKTLRTKKADDISISYLIILMAGITLITVYAFHIGDIVFILGNILSVVSTGILIVLRLRYGGSGVDKQD